MSTVAKSVLVLGLIVTATLLVYPVPQDYWIRYDNEGLIRNSPRVQALTLQGADRTAALREMFTTAHHDLYQPLLTFSLAIDYAMFGWNRTGWNVHSLALHVLCMFGLYLLAYRLAGCWSASLLAALVLTVHPVMVQAVSWTICRTFLLTAAWILIGTHLYLSHARNPRLVLAILATVAFMISMTAKLLPGVVFLPVLIDVWVRRKLTPGLVLDKLPLLAAVSFFTLLNMHFTGAVADQASVVRPWPEVVGDAPVGLVLTAANTIVPTKLALFYYRASAWDVVGLRWIAVACTGIVVLVLGGYLWRKDRPGLMLSAIGWVVLVVPSIAAGRFRETVAADRYAYVPAFFLALGLAELLAVLFPSRSSSSRMHEAGRSGGWYVSRLAVLLLAVPLAWQARSEARKWLDEARLWQTVIAISPHPTAYGALGNVYKERGQWAKAVEVYETALELASNDKYAPNNPIFHANLAQYARKAAEEVRGRSDVADREQQAQQYLDLARRVAAEGVRKWPDDARMHYYLGRVCQEQGRTDEAVDAFLSAIKLDPQHQKTLEYLGELARNKSGRPDLTVRVFSALADAHVKGNRFADAAAMYYNWAVLQPENAETHKRFFETVFQTASQKQYDKAEELLQRYLKKFPTSLQAKQLLGLICAQQGKFSLARPLLQECVDAEPNNARLRQALDMVNQRLRTRPPLRPTTATRPSAGS